MSDEVRWLCGFPLAYKFFWIPFLLWIYPAYTESEDEEMTTLVNQVEVRENVQGAEYPSTLSTIDNLGSANEGSNNTTEDIAVIHGTRWHLLAGALTLDEQAQLFGFIHEHDVTDWEKLAPCMNPTPKTLEFAQQQGAQSTRILSYSPNDKTAVIEMVTKAIGILGWHKAIKSMTVAAIRYCASATHPCIGSCFPPHIDHCNDGSWVVLFSLGLPATFHIQTPSMTQRHTFDMNSGDVLVFDPSSQAAILHGVAGVAFGEEAIVTGEELGTRFDVLRRSRFGVQCRVALME